MSKLTAARVAFKKKENEEGSVTNSATMLAAIREVDLVINPNLEDVEDTEKAKRTALDLKQERQWPKKDNLVKGRF